MQNILSWLIGKRTIIAATATAIWGALYTQGVISQQVFQAGAVIGISISHIFLRLAMNNITMIKTPVINATVIPPVVKQ